VSARVVSLDPGDQGFELRLADRRRFRAGAVVSTLDPITTFGELLGPERAGEVLTSVAEQWVLDPAGPFTSHYGIKGRAPTPATGDGNDDAVVRVVGFGSADEVAAHLDSVASGRLPTRPAGHLTTTSRHDPLQASPGPYGPLNTLRYETPAPYAHPSKPWDRARVEYREKCWELLLAEVGGLSEARLLFQFADSPQDLERRVTTARHGSVRQGSLQAGQTLLGRPDPSCADGRTPIPGLYLGGGSVHPGVPGSLGGGYNAAAVVCADLGLDRWWPANGGRPT
jgi:phytoene dehydrogenase-like protein